MTRVHALTTDPTLRISILPCDMVSVVIDMLPIRRPLDIPSAWMKMGKVLSHSGVLVHTSRGYFIVEYMATSQIYVYRSYKYEPGMESFNAKKYKYQLDSLEPFIPNQKITILDFVLKMKSYIQGKPFDTFTHNCHHARYDTMKYYGMLTENPDAGSHNLFYQGFVDYFSRKYLLKNDEEMPEEDITK